MLDDEDGDPVLADRFQELAQVLLLGGVHAGGGLVQREEARLGGERARDLEAALVAVGEVLGELIAARADAHVFEKLVGAFFDGAFLGARARPAQDRAEHARARAHVAPDHHVLERREIVEEPDVLEGARDPHACDAIRRRVLQLRTLEAETALLLAIDAGEDVEEGGLARAVGADEPVDLALADRERNLGERGEAAEALGDALDLEKRGHGRGGGRGVSHSWAPRARASSPARAGAPRDGTASSPPSRARRAACGSPRDR